MNNPYGNEQEGRSQIVIKTIMNYVRTITSRLSNTYLSTNTLVGLKGLSTPDIKNAENAADALNYFFNVEFPKYTFIKDVCKTGAKEGTVVIRTGWASDFDVVKNTINLPEENFEEARAKLEAAGWQIKHIPKEPKDGFYMGVKIVKLVQTMSRPDAYIVRTQDFWLNSGATSEHDAIEFWERFQMTRSDIRKQDKALNPNGIFENTEALMKKMLSSNTEQAKASTGSGIMDTQTSENTTIDNDPKKSREYVTLYRFTGKYDLDGDGITENVEAIFDEDFSTVLMLDEIRSPVKKPYHILAYDKEAWEKWGKALSHPIMEAQKIQTAAARSIIMSMALKANRQRAFDATRIDPHQRNLIELGVEGANIYVNGDPNGIVRDLGSYQDNNEWYMAYNMFGVESQKAVGISDIQHGLGSSPSMAKTATAASIAAGAADNTFEDFFNNINECLLKPMFSDWLLLIQEYMDIIEVPAKDEMGAPRAIQKANVSGKFVVEINISTKATADLKNYQLLQFMNVVPGLAQLGIPVGEILLEVVKQLAENWNIKPIPDIIRRNRDRVNEQDFQNQLMAMAQQMAAQVLQSQDMQQQIDNEATKRALNFTDAAIGGLE